MPFGTDVAPHAPAQRRRQLLTAGLMLHLAVIAILAVLLALVLSNSRSAYETQARQTAQALAAVAQENVASELSRVDALMQAALYRLAGDPAAGPQPDSARNGLLHAYQGLVPSVEGLRMADASGRVRWGNDLPPGAQIDISDREYFHRARRHPDGGVLIAGPLKSRVSGHWVIALVRPVLLDGRFDGVIYATVPVDHFRRLFERYDLGELDSMTLRTSALQLTARLAPGSPDQGMVGSTTVSLQLQEALALDLQQGTFVSRVPIDGIDRTTAYHRVHDWPFIVFAGLGNERFFAPWYAQVWQGALLALITWVIVAVGTYTVYRAWRRESHTVQALAAQTRRTQALMRVAADGIHIVDEHGRLVGLSDSFAEMLGSTREQLMGRHISSWDANQNEAAIAAWLGKIKAGDRQRVEVQHRRDDGALIDVELQLAVTDIEGQRLIFSSARDVTDKKRLMQEQAAMLDTDMVGMLKLKGLETLWKNRALERMFGYAPGELDGLSARALAPDDAAFDEMAAKARPALTAGRHYRTQLQMRHKNGHPIWVDLNGVMLSDDVSFWMMLDITVMKEAQARIEHIALHDALTQLPNRLLLGDRLNQAILAANRSNKRVAVCYLDLDGFKDVNDAHGHDAGDALLAEVARRLQSSLRKNDTAARIGGDEFVVLLTMLGADEEWRQILDRVVSALQAPVALPGGLTVHVGTSIGVAIMPADATDAADLLTQADQAMLRAKRAGKGKIERAAP